MLTKKEIKLLVKVQKSTLTLYTKGQLPKCLASRIQRLNARSDANLFTFLSECCEHYLRVVGYYKKYPKENQRVEIEMCLRMKEKGLI